MRHTNHNSTEISIIIHILMSMMIIRFSIGYQRFSRNNALINHQKLKNSYNSPLTKLYKTNKNTPTVEIDNNVGILMEQVSVGNNNNNKQSIKSKRMVKSKIDVCDDGDIGLLSKSGDILSEDIIIIDSLFDATTTMSVIDTAKTTTTTKKKRTTTKENNEKLENNEISEVKGNNITNIAEVKGKKQTKVKKSTDEDTTTKLSSISNVKDKKSLKSQSVIAIENIDIISSSHLMTKNIKKKTSSILLHPPTKEQQLIIEEVRNQKSHLRVRAVAGSGKTTTTLNIASELPHLSMLILLYNSKLKDETRSKIDKLQLTNLEAHSFHAFGSKYYNQNCGKDAGLEILCKEDIAPRNGFSYDWIIIDEVQDMKPTLYKFVNKVMRDNKKEFNLLLLGDEKQTIYGYDGADSRYLTLSDQLYQTRNDNKWKELSLSTTFRLSGNIAKFMNKFVIGYDLFESIKQPGDKVTYYWGNAFDCVREIHSMLVELLSSGRYKPSDIFLLTNSVKHGKADAKTPLNVLENALRDSGFSIYTPDNDDSNTKNKEKAMEGKIVIDTYHSTKGMEKKIVVNFGFSMNYFKFYNKRAVDRTNCPSIYYVGATRASDKLIIVGEDIEGERFPFLRDITDNEFLEVKKVGRPLSRVIAEEKHSEEFKRFTPTSLVDYLPDYVVRDAMAFIKLKTINQSSRLIPLKSIIETSPGFFEEVSLLNGLAIPALYEARNKKGRSSIQTEALRTIKNNNNETAIDQSLVMELDNTFTDDDISGYLRLATIYNYATTGFTSKLTQISQFDWVKLDEAEKCMKILGEHLGDQKVNYESNINFNFESKNGTQVRLSGRIDALTDTDIWELKCTEKLEEMHILQLVVYAWMKQQQKDYSKDMKFKLLNMRSSELLELVSDFSELDSAVKVLIEYKMKEQSNVSDEEFINQNLKIRNGRG